MVYSTQSVKLSHVNDIIVILGQVLRWLLRVLKRYVRLSAKDYSVLQGTVDFVLYISKGIKHLSKTNKQVFVKNYMLKQLFTRT